MDANEFCRLMGELPEPPTTSKPPFWAFWQHDLWQHVTQGNDPERFAEWPCIYHTMRLDHRRNTTDKEFDALLKADYRYLEACLMPDFGTPKDYYAVRYSAVLIHQAHHLYRYEEWSGDDVRNLNRIFEFGGGYGAMALVCRRLGFKGVYTIYDLPEFSLLQQYYLSNTFNTEHTYWIGDLVSLGGLPYQDLFVACFSLSEVDFKMRNEILRRGYSRSYLLLYSNRFADYDNEGYFSRHLPVIVPKVDWHTVHADHLPDYNLYTFGKAIMSDIASLYTSRPVLDPMPGEEYP